MEMKVISAVNPRFSNKEKTAISLEVKFGHMDEICPFTSVKGHEGYTGQLYDDAIAGKFGEISPWVDYITDHIKMVSKETQSEYLVKATSVIGTIVDKIEIRGSTPELEDLLKRLKTFRMDVMDLDEDPKWPYVDFPDFPV